MSQSSGENNQNEPGSGQYNEKNPELSGEDTGKKKGSGYTLKDVIKKKQGIEQGTYAEKKHRAGKRRYFKRIFSGFLVTLFIFLVAGYFYVTSPDFLEPFIKNQFEKMSSGKIHFKVKQASLFRGFIFEDIEILSGPDFDYKPLLQMKKLSLLYNLYGFWSGDFGVHEVGIHQPRIYLYQKNDTWNVQTLMKPGEPEKKEPEKESESEPGEMPEKISLPFSVRAFFKFVLEDFHLKVESDASNTNPIQVGVKNFTFKTHILTQKISEIPLNVSAVKLIDTFLVQLNPDKVIDIYFSNPTASTDTPFNLHWLLAYDGESQKPGFISQLKIGHNNIPVRFKGKHLLPLDLAIDYDLRYAPEQDRLNLSFFRMGLLKQKWLQMSGKIDQATDPDNMNIDLKITESDINLTELYPHYRNFTGDHSMRFGGHLSLAPLTIQGPVNTLFIDGKLQLRNVYAYMPGMPVNIPYFKMYYETKLALDKKEGIPLEYANAGYDGSLNGSTLKARINYIPAEKVFAGIYVYNFNPSPFSSGMARGLFNVNFTVQGRSENHLTANATVYSNSFFYVLDRAKSGTNRFRFDLNANIHSPDMQFKYININVPTVNMSLKNEEQRKALYLNSNAKVTMVNTGATNMNLRYDMNEFTINVQNLYPTLPEKFQESLADAKDRMQQDVTLRGSTSVNMLGNRQHIVHNTRFFIDDFGIDDIELHANVTMWPHLIKIKGVGLSGLNYALAMDVTGELREGWVEEPVPQSEGKTRKVKAMIPDVHLDLKFSKKQREKIFRENSIEGTVNLKAHMKGQTAQGTFIIDKFYFDDGRFTRVNNVNMEFPFLHKLDLKKTLNLTAANKERIIKNYNFSEPFNFTIESVEVEHPTTPNQSFKLIYPNSKYPGFGATMVYEDNVFKINALQFFMFNGLVSGQDILFNVGRGRPDEMEYMAQLQIKDIDLKQLIPDQKAEAIQDGTIRTDMFVVGNRLDQPIENMRGYVSVYKIGEEFGKQALKVVKPDSGVLIDAAIDNSIIVKKVDLDIKEGLVYAQIIYQKGWIGSIIGPAGESIEQERIPIPEFMQRAGKEAEVYKLEEDKKNQPDA